MPGLSRSSSTGTGRARDASGHGAEGAARRGGLRGLIWRIGTPARWTLVAAARVYRATLSPLVPFHCRFQPTCSQYFIEAVRRHGALRGTALGVWRVLRCNPLSRGGDDPVP